MLNSLINNVVTSFIINILIDVAIFNIIYSCINSGVRYSRSVIIYVICLEIKQILITGIVSFSAFLISFGVYFIIGLVLIWILNKIGEYFPRMSFIGTSIILQNIIVWILGMII